MTREEEMLEAVTKEHGELSKREISVTLTAIEWADKEHGKELMYAIQKTGERTKREDINKGCEYLRTHLWQSVDDDNDPIVESVHNITLDDFIKDFKKYLEE